VGDLAHAIGTVCRDAGYGIPDGFGGHGAVRRTHEDPPVPNEGRPGRGLPPRHGMVPAFESMLIGGGADRRHAAPDGWTLRTDDGSRAAHAEDTVACTDAGRLVLTAR
jgi:methionyl aminopeptidase